MHSAQLSLHDLNKKAYEIREDIIDMLVEAKSGHSAGPLGLAEVFTALYFHVLRHDPNNPNWEGRDYFLLSNGHVCPVWYAALAEAGYFDKRKLKTLRKLGSPLQGHPHRGSLPGIENTSGPLGQGISAAAGIAMSLRIDQKPNQVFCVASDGEQQEGQTWEAYMFAGKNRLHNLTVLIDRNNIQIDGETEDVMPLQPFKTKLSSFRWNVLDIDGHNIEQIIDACSQARATQEQPTAIVCNTIPGKGVEFKENDYQWHGKPPTKKEGSSAVEHLRSLGGSIWWE